MQRGYSGEWGAQFVNGGVRFRLWAPAARSVALVLLDGAERVVPMTPSRGGWYELVEPSALAGSRYLFEIDGTLRVADPASRFQPDGPQKASEVVDPAAFDWPDEQFFADPFGTAAIYEIHVGTFTPEGTYEAAASKLAEIVALGASAIELMPLSQAPGGRNWGYDGVLHYAPNHCYGRPDDLKRFVVRAHASGLAVILDVVYNHFGPEGNYLSRYAPQFFSDRIRTPWGHGIDYSSPGNDPVRAYVVDNACYWVAEYEFDGLRLDAVPMIEDTRPRHIVDELSDRARTSAGRRIWLIAEDVKNELPPERLHAFDGRWSDDVHHALHVAIAGECSEYFGAFRDAPVECLGKALTAGGLPRVAYLQNHDQIGNRPFGERIGQLAPESELRAAVAIVLLAPQIPLLFMGEEWAASTPFLFFCDFEPGLAKRVAQGRRIEFAGLAEFQNAKAAELPDPGAPETFERSKLRWDETLVQPHAQWFRYYRELIEIRKRLSSRCPAASELGGGYELIGSAGLSAWWILGDATRLRLEANLSEVSLSGFSPGRSEVIFATPGFDADTAPAWSVRWSFGE